MSTTITAIKTYGSDKMVFGRDMPIDGVDTYRHNPKGDRSLYQDYFYELPKLITGEEYDKILKRINEYSQPYKTQFDENGNYIKED